MGARPHCGSLTSRQTLMSWTEPAAHCCHKIPRRYGHRAAPNRILLRQTEPATHRCHKIRGLAPSRRASDATPGAGQGRSRGQGEAGFGERLLVQFAAAAAFDFAAAFFGADAAFD